MCSQITGWITATLVAGTADIQQMTRLQWMQNDADRVVKGASMLRAYHANSTQLPVYGRESRPGHALLVSQFIHAVAAACLQ